MFVNTNIVLYSKAMFVYEKQVLCIKFYLCKYDGGSLMLYSLMSWILQFLLNLMRFIRCVCCIIELLSFLRRSCDNGVLNDGRRGTEVES